MREGESERGRERGRKGGRERGDGERTHMKELEGVKRGWREWVHVEEECCNNERMWGGVLGRWGKRGKEAVCWTMRLPLGKGNSDALMAHTDWMQFQGTHSPLYGRTAYASSYWCSRPDAVAMC